MATKKSKKLKKAKKIQVTKAPTKVSWTMTSN